MDPVSPARRDPVPHRMATGRSLKSTSGQRRHLAVTEAGERLAVGFPLPQDRDPAEAGLGTFEDQELEQRTVVVNRDAPFLIVVADIDGVCSTPPTASDAA